MKKRDRKRLLVTMLAAALITGSLTPLPAQAAEPYDSLPVYRVYNHNTGEHFYTISEAEYIKLQREGWEDEGIGWFGAKSGSPVYRVYNPYALGGDHYYTLNHSEAENLVKLGWKWDNNGNPVFYSDGEVSLYEAYNPYAESGAHNYTTDRDEQELLLNLGWKYDKVAWRVKAVGATFEHSGKTKADVDIVDTGGGEILYNYGSYRWIYSDRTFDDADLGDELPACDFSADVLMKGTTSDYGTQFVIAGTREQSGQVGIDMHYQAGSDARYAQGRINFMTINFPADSGNYGQQYYTVNTKVPYIKKGDTVRLQVKYYDSGYVQTFLNGEMYGQYRTKLRHEPEFILHFQASAPTTVSNIKVIKYGKDVTHNATYTFDKDSYYVDTTIPPVSGIY